MSLFSATPNIHDRNAVDFANALGEAAEGHALWDPSPIAERGGVEGDCGYFDGGRFQRLFSLYSPPGDLAIEDIPRPYGDDKIVDQVNNRNDVVLSHKSYSVQFTGNFQMPPLPQLPFLTVGCGAERTVQQQTLAFLAFCGPKRAVHKDRRLRLFENYLLQHGDAIVAKYGERCPVTFNTLVIIYQSTRCISWFSGLKHQSSASSSGHVDAEVSGIGGSTSMKVERYEYRIPADKRGPEFWDAHAEPSHSIVLRTVAVKRRSPGSRLWRAILAVAGFKPGGKRLGGAAGPPYSTGTSNAASLTQQPSTSKSDDTADSASTTFSSTPEVEPEILKSNLVAEQHDLLTRALIQTLSARPELDVVVGSWDVVLGTAAQESCGVQVEDSGNGIIGRLVSGSIEAAPSHISGLRQGENLSTDDVPALPSVLPTSETPRHTATLASSFLALFTSRDELTSGRHNARPAAELADAAMSPETQPLLANEHIKHWEQPKGKLSACPALNTLCNHNAYGMPRDGQGVHAAVLAHALTEVYGMNKWFSRLIVYAAVLGINKGYGLTINMEQLYEKPISHGAAIAHANPDAKGRVVGHQYKDLSNLVVHLAEVQSSAMDGELPTSIKAFADWRNTREQNPIAGNKQKFLFGHPHITADEVALLLQVLSDNKWTVKSEELECFVTYERLPGDQKWTPRRSIGYWSTIRVNRQILDASRAISEVPFTAILIIALCAMLGVLSAICIVGVYEGPFHSLLVALGRSRSPVDDDDLFH